MSRLLSIDPGNAESGWCVIDTATCEPLQFGKTENHKLLNLARTINDHPSTVIDRAVIEMVGHYGTGMPAGKDVFETCVWIGRFAEALDRDGTTAELVKRGPVKLHHCGSSRAKDSNITQALVDRFAPGQPNHGKGTKASPGFFYGFKADVWAAYALAVYAADTDPIGDPR